MPETFRRYCESTIALLHAQSQTAALVRHAPSLGAIRERAIHDLLRNHLPSMVRIVSGQIFDTHDQQSSQQDVVLTLKNVPRLPFASGIDMIYAEGVVATIEIKSNLSGPVVRSICDNIHSVRQIKPVIWGTSSSMVNHKWPPERILSAVLTYKGSSLEALARVLDEEAEEKRPDLILDLSQGILLQNHGLLVPRNGSSNFISLKDPGFGLMLFLTVLTEISSTLASRGVSWRSYMDAPRQEA